MFRFCAGRDCKLRFKDLPKNGRYAVKNISLPQYNWVSDILNSEGVDIDISEKGEWKMCNKYLKQKPSEISGDKENAGFEFLMTMISQNIVIALVHILTVIYCLLSQLMTCFMDQILIQNALCAYSILIL